MKYTDKDWFDIELMVCEAKALNELFREYYPDDFPEALEGFRERLLMEMDKLGIDWE